MKKPKWTWDTFLEKWLNGSGNFWYQIESMNVLHVNYGLDFAFSPRGPCPRPFLLQKFVARKCCHLAVKKGNWLSVCTYKLHMSNFDVIDGSHQYAV